MDYKITIFTSFIQAHTQNHTQTTQNCAENNELSLHILHKILLIIYFNNQTVVAEKR